jgi:hypothetical protein
MGIYDVSSNEPFRILSHSFSNTCEPMMAFFVGYRTLAKIAGDGNFSRRAFRGI